MTTIDFFQDSDSPDVRHIIDPVLRARENYAGESAGDE
jgi:hypothetical protein